MRTRVGKGRKFYVYGISRFSLWWRREYVIEETDWAPDEMHRGGMAFIVHLGFVCFGVGEFEIGLDPEELERIEDEAVWLNVAPSKIGRWRGAATARTFEELGRGFEVPRPEAPAEAGAHEHDGTEAVD